MGQQHGGGVVAGPDEAEPDGPPGPRGDAGPPAAAGAGRGDGRGPPLFFFCFSFAGGALEQEADPLQRSALQPLVDRGGVRQGEDARDQRFGVDLALGDQIQEALQVAPLGPADVARRVIKPFDLVVRVVTARAVRAGEPDVQLLLVVGVPGQVQLALADVDHGGPVASQTGRRLDRGVGGAAGHKEHPVGPQAARRGGQVLLDGGQPVGVRSGAEEGAGLLGQPAALRHHVNTDDPHPGGDQQLDDELADQAQADHASGIPELGAGLADALHGDGTDGGEGGHLGADAVGHRHAQVLRYPVDLRMQGKLVAGAGHQLPDLELFRAPPDLGHHARQ